MLINETDNSKVYFVSFGNSYYYKKLSAILLKSIKKVYPHGNFKLFTRNDLKYYPKDAIQTRGYGFYLWKPSVLLKCIQNLNDGDILIYIDGRAKYKSSAIRELDIMKKYDTIDIIAPLSNYKELEYTKQEVFDYFKISENNPIKLNNQLQSGYFLIRVSDTTRMFISNWYSIMSKNRFLINDEILSRQHKEFKENRHDQSIFSILIRLFKLETYDIGDYDNSAVIPGYYKHEEKNFPFTLLNYFPVKLIVLLAPFRPFLRQIKKSINIK